MFYLYIKHLILFSNKVLEAENQCLQYSNLQNRYILKYYERWSGEIWSAWQTLLFSRKGTVQKLQAVVLSIVFFLIY